MFDQGANFHSTSAGSATFQARPLRTLIASIVGKKGGANASLAMITLVSSVSHIRHACVGRAMVIGIVQVVTRPAVQPAQVPVAHV